MTGETPGLVLPLCLQLWGLHCLEKHHFWAFFTYPPWLFWFSKLSAEVTHQPANVITELHFQKSHISFSFPFYFILLVTHLAFYLVFVTSLSELKYHLDLKFISASLAGSWGSYNTLALAQPSDIPWSCHGYHIFITFGRPTLELTCWDAPWPAIFGTHRWGTDISIPWSCLEKIAIKTGFYLSSPLGLVLSLPIAFHVYPEILVLMLTSLLLICVWLCVILTVTCSSLDGRDLLCHTWMWVCLRQMSGLHLRASREYMEVWLRSYNSHIEILQLT